VDRGALSDPAESLPAARLAARPARWRRPSARPEPGPAGPRRARPPAPRNDRPSRCAGPTTRTAARR